MISEEKEVNWFAQIHLMLEAKFGDNPLHKETRLTSRDIYKE